MLIAVASDNTGFTQQSCAFVGIQSVRIQLADCWDLAKRRVHSSTQPTSVRNYKVDENKYHPKFNLSKSPAARKIFQ
jgi:hypothetical protein